MLIFQKYYKNTAGEYERDSMGHLKKTDISDDEVKNRTNYQKNNLNFIATYDHLMSKQQEDGQF